MATGVKVGSRGSVGGNWRKTSNFPATLMRKMRLSLLSEKKMLPLGSMARSKTSPMAVEVAGPAAFRPATEYWPFPATVVMMPLGSIRRIR